MKLRRDFDSQVTSQYCKVRGSIVACGRTDFRTGLTGRSVYYLAALYTVRVHWCKFETGWSANGVRKVQILH